MANKVALILLAVIMLCASLVDKGSSPEKKAEITPVTRFAIEQLNERQDTIISRLDTTIGLLRQAVNKNK